MKNCLNCKTLFSPKRKEQKYCCPKCSINPRWGWYGGTRSNNLVKGERK